MEQPNFRIIEPSVEGEAGLLEARVESEKGHRPEPHMRPRRDPRFELELFVNVGILIQEETLRARQFAGLTVDASRRGMKIQILSLPQGVFRKLMASKRFIQVAFIDPTTEIEVKVTGKIAWMDYHNRERLSESSGACVVGVTFEELKPEDLADYNSFMSRVVPIESGVTSHA